jgi:hypothetical protein
MERCVRRIVPDGPAKERRGDDPFRANQPYTLESFLTERRPINFVESIRRSSE